MNEKQNKKESKQRWKKEQEVLFRKSLPMDETLFPVLFDYLDAELDICACNHELRMVEKFCVIQNIDFIKLQVWLRDHGGYCDCEVLANTQDYFQYLEAPILYESRLKVDAKEKLNTLVTDFGFEIQAIPAPWLLYKITKKGKTFLKFQIGKKADLFNYTLLTNDWSIKMLNNEEALFKYWRKEVEIDEAELVIEKGVVGEFQQIIVKSPNYSSSFIFTFPSQSPTWALITRSESQRLRGDLKELANLLEHISLV